MRFSLRNLRQRDIAIILVVLTIVGGVLWYFYLYQPAQDRIAALESEITRLDVEIRRGEDARRNLPELRLAVALLEEERRVFLSQLPTESQIADVIDDLRLSAEAAGVAVERFGQGSASEDVQNVRPIGFTVATSGTFGETMIFLGVLEQLQRYTKLNQVSLAASADDTTDPDLTSDVGFTVYVFTGTDPGER
ncbi:MAG: type 4a pilus biogenesis protein PilO [Trueperaceae bacterium]